MEKKYRPCVGVALFNADGLVFIGERIDNPGSWQMPQGGIDENEDILSAALRELEEETGIKPDKIELIKILDDWFSYDIPPEVLGRLPWGKDYQGQKQKWISLRFTGEESDINLRSHDPPEFQNWKWSELESVPATITPFKIGLYNRLIPVLRETVRD